MTPRPGSDHEADPNGPTPSDNTPAAGGPAVERIIERFGGIRPMAHKLDIPVTTVQGWKKRGAIPLNRHADLRAAAAKRNIKLDEADLEAATPIEDRPTPAGAPVDAADSVTPLPPEAAALSAPEGVEAEKTPEKLAEGAELVEPVIIAGPAHATEVPAAEPVSTEPKPEDIKPAEPSVEPATAEPVHVEPAPVEPVHAETTRVETPVVEPIEPVQSAAAAYEPPHHHVHEERRSGAGFATAVSLLALLVGAAALSEPWWGPRVPGWPASGAAPAQQAAAPAPAAQPDPALRTQLQQIADRVGRLEQRPAPAAGNGGNAGGVDPQVLENALRQLSGRIDQLDQRVQQAASAGGAAAPQPDPRVNQLAERLGGIEQRVSAVGANTQAAEELRKEVDGLKQQLASVNQVVETRRDAATAAQALVLAAGQLRSALATGQPFQQELQAVRALGVNDPQVTQPLDAVAGYAAKGVPTQPQLADRFQSLSSDIVRADNQGEGGDWVNQVTGKLATLVTVRRQGGGVVGDSAGAVVARAEAAVQEGNLAKAVEELGALKGPAANTAAPWVADAKARLAANQAGQQLTTRAIGLLSQSAGGATGEKGAGQ
ncbi:mitofilin family membrane protein [Azospirillum sp. sgz302134]